MWFAVAGAVTQIAQHRARLFLARLFVTPPHDCPFTGLVHRGTKK
jgi:hypothetical protein